ncbi:MAG: hypothetical protein QF886_21635, partial [Planctomycetota bacterium]|nr:hypothetical protein [Planctomycetota bacterium]
MPVATMRMFSMALLRWSGLFLIGTTSLLHPAPSAKKQAEGRLLLENDHVRAIIDAADGASLISFVLKPDNIEQLGGPSFVDSNILPARRVQDLSKLSFNVTVPERSPEKGEAVWSLSARLPKEAGIDFGGQMVGRAYEAITYNPSAVLEWPRPYENLVFTKSYRLQQNSSALSVDYDVRNEGDKGIELCLGTTHSFAGSVMCIPTRDGAATFRLPIADPRKLPLLENTLAPWLYDVPAAWMAMLKKDKT